MKNYGKALLIQLVIFILTPHAAWAWGERAHHIIGSLAAKNIQVWAENPAESSALTLAFDARAIQMGHLNNIPDTSWRDIRHGKHDKEAVRFGNPTHYFDPEILIGLPSKPISDYLDQIRNIDPNFQNLLKTFEGKKSPIPNVDASKEKIQVFFHAGTSPWRASQFYALAVEAFRCAKSKENKNIEIGDFKNPILSKKNGPAFRCQPESSTHEDLYAAFVFLGVMGHFVADMAQPYHATMDYDGWHSGAGGIHRYFETHVFSAYGEDLSLKVQKKISNRRFRERTIKELSPLLEEKKIEAKNSHWVTRLIFNLTANSYKEISRLFDIDKKYAVIKPSEVTPWGSSHRGRAAERKPPTDKRVLRAFKSITIERLSIASVALSYLWFESWKEAGKPDLNSFGYLAAPYPLNVPFVWPDYYGR